MMKNFMNLRTLIALVAMVLFANLGISQTLPYTFVNSSSYPDNQVYIAIVGITGGHVWVDPVDGSVHEMSVADNTVPGPIIGGNMGPGNNALYADCFRSLSQIPGNVINIPKIAGCRIFFSFGSPLYLYFFGYSGSPSGYAAPNLSNETDPNQGIKFEMAELTYNDIGLWINTTRVDCYQYPVGLEVWGDGFYKKVGELMTHDQIISQWQSTAPSEFQGLCDAGQGIIHFPTKHSSFPQSLIQTYIDQIWSKYSGQQLVFSSGDAGVWRGSVSGTSFVFTRDSDGQVATIAGKPTTLEAMEALGVMAQGGQWDLVIQAQMAAAINRHAIDLNLGSGVMQDFGNAANYYQTWPYNWYAKFFHRSDISMDSKTYAFSYDDVFDQSATVHTPSPQRITLTLGGFNGDDSGGTDPDPGTYYAIPGTIEAENYSSMSGVELEACSEGGQNVGWIDNGDFMVWNVNVASAGTYLVEYRVASLSGGGTIELEKAGGTPDYGTLAVPSTGDWQSWTTISHTVTLPTAGQQQIAINVPSGGYNINWLRFTATSDPDPDPDPSGEDITNLGGTTSAQYDDSPSAERFPNLTDNNINTKYLTFHSIAWVQYQAPAQYIVTGYSITSANDAAERDPKDWNLQGSNDGVNWTALDTRAGEDFPNRFQTRSFEFGNTSAFQYYRFNMNNNSGSILQLAEIEIFGTAAGGGTGFSTLIEAENYVTMSGVELEACSEGGQNVGWIDAGDWMVWDVDLPSSGTYTVEYRIASASGGGSIQLERAGGSPVYGTISVPSTGGWQAWTTISHNVTLDAGAQQLAIYVPAGGYNINWIQITQGYKSAGSNIEEEVELSELSVYPNPASDYINLKGIDSEASIEIYTITGSKLSQTYGKTIDISSLRSGMYILKVTTENAIQSVSFMKK